MLSRYIKPIAAVAGTVCCLVVLGACSSVPAPKVPLSGDRQAPNSLEGAAAPLSNADLPKVSDANRAAFAQAIEAMNAQQWQTAETLLLKITQRQPQLSGPWVNLAQVRMAQEQPEEARLALRRAIEVNPGNCAAHNRLGVLSRQMGDFDSAESHYKACLSAQPDFEDAYLNLGILYELYLGRLPEALAAYRQYQDLTDAPDRKVQGWVMDLERRLGV